MKKFVFTFILFSLFFGLSHAQNGLEQVIVEKYYISDANDASADATDGVLPVGSTTYRIFLDLLPGYIFQSAYGDANHELNISTTTSYFNNELRGSTSPTYKLNNAKSNTVMLDSWLTAGGACAGQIGVLKSDDDGISTVVNSNGLLKNNNPIAGIPISVQDGMVPGTPPSVITVGITDQLHFFDNENTIDKGAVFSTRDGAWASLSGAHGADSISNKVLIAQMTTDGVFSFELNIQIRSSNFQVEQYVARNPVDLEKSIPSLIYHSDSVIVANKIIQKENSFKIYPNPSHGMLTIEYPEFNSNLGFYTIYDFSGRSVLSGNLSKQLNKEYVNISNLISGIYIVGVYYDGVIHHNRIIKS